MAFSVFVSLFLLYWEHLFKQYFYKVKMPYLMVEQKCVCCFSIDKSDSSSSLFVETEITVFFFFSLNAMKHYNCFT